MFSYNILAGSTDQSVVIRIIDSTDGTPETGVVFNTSGIDLEYRRELEASVDITEATLAALTTAHADGGFLHIGNGYYRLDLPDAALAAGSSGCLVHGTVTGMVVVGCYISLTPYPANVAQISGDATAADNLELAFDDTAGAVAHMGIVDQGTAQSATSTTLVLRAAAAFANSEIVGSVIVITGGTTGVGQAREITAYTGATDTATVDAWTTTPTGTITYKVYASPPAPTTAPAVNVTHVGGTAQTAGDIIADTDDIQTRLPAALISGRLDVSVGAMQANVLTAAATAADFTTEIQTGLATPTNITAGTITNLTNAPTAGDLTAAMKASVNAEVLDVLNTDTFAEPGQGTPAATASLAAKIGYLYKAWRNRKTQTATTFSLMNDDAVTVDHKSTVSDDGTTGVIGEIATGP